MTVTVWWASCAAAGVVYLPDARHSSETGFGLGGKVMYRFCGPGCPAEAPPWEIKAKGLLTFRSQGKASIATRLPWREGTYALKAKIAYSDLASRFWGLGPDTPAASEEIYRPRSLLAYVELFRQIRGSLSVGLRYEYERVTILEKEAGGLLDSTNILGRDGRTVLGLGVVVEWDTRDDSYSPTSGAYYQGYSLWFNDEFGSEHDFDAYHVDLRNYFRLASDHVLATQFFLYAARGGAPFWRYAALGGRPHTRGYRKARYLDHTLVALQGEYRFPLWKRLGMVVFGGLGDVGPSLDRLQLAHMRPTLGAGLRYQPRASSGLKIRFDMGAGQNSLRFYLALDEAF